MWPYAALITETNAAALTLILQVGFVPVLMLICIPGSGAEESWHCGSWGICGGGLLHYLPYPGCLPDPGSVRKHTYTHTLLTNIWYTGDKVLPLHVCGCVWESELACEYNIDAPVLQLDI